MIAALALLGGCTRAGGSGCVPSPSIQAALDAAQDGDVVEVCDGLYRERLSVVGRTLTLRSVNGPRATTVDGSGGTTLTVTDGAVLTVEGFTLANGVAEADGGDVWCSESTLTLSDSALDRGEAARGGGLAAVGCTVDLTGNDLVDNTATGEGGGGVWLVDSVGHLVGNRFEANTAYLGGGAYLVGDDLVFEANTLGSNVAGYGGGLYLAGSSAVVDDAFRGNSATQEGGGLYVLDGVGPITGNEVVDNWSEFDGGGLYLLGGAPTVDGNSFFANGTGEDGGALRVKLSGASITDNVFSTNAAAAEGGAAKISHRGTLVRGNTFVGNSAGTDGGALCLDQSSSTLADDLFVENDAHDGGGLYVSPGWDPVVVQDTVFAANRAVDRGGNVCVDLPGVRFTLLRVTSATGTARVGGGLYALDGDLDLRNAVFYDDAATEAGGALYLERGVAALANLVMWHNQAPSGSAMVVDGVAADLVDTVVAGNRGGAAVQVRAGPAPTWRYDDLFDNGPDLGVVDPTGAGGNLAVDPDFADAFALAPDSRLRNAGDPELADPDGSRSDLGRFGGPAAFAGP